MQQVAAVSCSASLYDSGGAGFGLGFSSSINLSWYKAYVLVRLVSGTAEPVLKHRSVLCV